MIFSVNYSPCPRKQLREISEEGDIDLGHSDKEGKMMKMDDHKPSRESSWDISMALDDKEVKKMDSTAEQEDAVVQELPSG